MIKLINILKEAKIVPSTNIASFPYSNHPALYNFIKANKEKILQTLKNIDERFENSTGIFNIPDAVVDDYNYWDVDSEQKKEFPNGQEIIIGQNKDIGDDCKGVIISNLSGEIHDKFKSGVDFKKMPEPYGNVGLYYDYSWC